jgi:hypothetical protein
MSDPAEILSTKAADYGTGSGPAIHGLHSRCIASQEFMECVMQVSLQSRVEYVVALKAGRLLGLRTRASIPH